MRRKLTVEELLERYAAGERNFSYTDLGNLSLSGVNLSRINLTRANLENTDLSGANLSNVCFERADIRNCNFRGANLQDASFAEAGIFDSDLRGANLDRFVIIEGVIESCNMEGASLRHADLGATGGIVNTNLRNANLEGCVGEISVANVDLTGAVGFRLRLVRAGYWNLTLPDSRFIADWQTEEI